MCVGVHDIVCLCLCLFVVVCVCICWCVCVCMFVCVEMCFAVRGVLIGGSQGNARKEWLSEVKDSVVELFQIIDADNSQTITREELGNTTHPNTTTHHSTQYSDTMCVCVSQSAPWRSRRV